MVVSAESDVSAVAVAEFQRLKIEDLPVGYNEGKIVERNRDQALQWQQLADALATRVSRNDSLAEETHLSYLLRIDALYERYRSRH